MVVPVMVLVDVTAPPLAIVNTGVALSLNTAILPVDVELSTLNASPVVAPVRLVSALVTVSVFVAAITVFWFRFMTVAFVVPIFKATAVAVSRVGVRMFVSAWPVPEIQKLDAACWEAIWFWTKLALVRPPKVLAFLAFMAYGTAASRRKDSISPSQLGDTAVPPMFMDSHRVS